MNLAELQEILVDDLRPAAQRLAARHPAFTAQVLRRLVERTPSRFPTAFFINDADREDFVASVSFDLAEQPVGGLGPFWLIVLFQVLLPALIRVFLLWWSETETHRTALRALCDQLAAEAPATTAAARRPWSWGG